MNLSMNLFDPQRQGINAALSGDLKESCPYRALDYRAWWLKGFKEGEKQIAYNNESALSENDKAEIAKFREMLKEL